MAGDGCHLRNKTVQKLLIFVVVVMGILLYMTSEFSPVHRVQTPHQVGEEKVHLKPEISEDALFGETNTGIQFKIDLHQRKAVVKVPFDVFYATLTVKTKPDVASVIMYLYETRKYNFTVALESNFINIKLIRSNQSLKSSTTIDVKRQHRKITYKDNGDVQVCYLEQDCSFIIYSDRKCGLQAMKYRSQSEYVDGYWRLKCNDCSQESSCLWSQANWVEAGGEVTAPTLPDGDRLRTCFKDYQLLFLGDSTLRGVMQAIIEKVNTTLHYGIRNMASTNYTKVGLNTNFSLTYYNSYIEQQAMNFNMTLQVLPSNYPIIGRGDSTMLLIGGTQWLTESHIHDVKDFIMRNGIPPRNVFVKLSTSGFHVKEKTSNGELLPVTTLIKQNKAVKKLATENGFGVVDSLQLTLSRYKEFRQGTCACHFHTIYKYRGKVGKDPRTHTLHHVVGDLNNVYTHMLLKKMCPLNGY